MNEIQIITKRLIDRRKVKMLIDEALEDIYKEIHRELQNSETPEVTQYWEYVIDEDFRYTIKAYDKSFYLTLNDIINIVEKKANKSYNKITKEELVPLITEMIKEKV